MPSGEYPLVSVLIPCYNAEPYLADAIDSSLNQSYPNVEVIVVNDGSTDGSERVAKGYGDRIVYLSQPNRGVSIARNNGLRVARGEFVILCDADDILLPDCVEKKLQPMLDDPTVGLVAGWYREIDPEGRLIDRLPEKRKLRGGSPFYDVVHRNYGPPMGWMIRSEALERCGVFDPLMKHCEDWDLLIRIMTRYRMAYVSEATAYYRQVPTSHSKDFLAVYDWVKLVRKRNAINADSAILYWWHGTYQQFELGRRILYAVLTTGPKPFRIRRFFSYLARRPGLIWIGVASAFSYLGGKRATVTASDSPSSASNSG